MLLSSLAFLCLLSISNAFQFPKEPEGSPQQPIENAYFGDVVLNDKQAEALKEGKDMGVGYGAQNNGNLVWTNAVIPYYIDCSLEYMPSALEAIRLAMQEWENKTCIRFVKKTNEKYALKFFRNTHCWGHVGMVSYSAISVGDGCDYQNVMTHEIGHVVGFYHEQNRKDRDENVKVHWENIGRFRSAFDIVNNTDSLGVPYDYESIMHYPWTAFSSNGKITMEPIKPTNGKVPYIELSKDDALQTSKLYNCPKIEKERARARAFRIQDEIQDAGDCEDKHRACEPWAKDGHCSTNSKVREMCPKSCKSPSCNDCRDKHKHCASWARMGHCELRQIVRDTCPLSCKVCQGPPTMFPPRTRPPRTRPAPTKMPQNKNIMGVGLLCLDRYEKCEKWRSWGHCTLNPGFMLKRCMKSCKKEVPELIRCDNEPQRPEPNGKCSEPLGMHWNGQNWTLPDSALTSPDHLKPGQNWHASAPNARLYYHDDFENKRIAAWCSASHDQARDPSRGYVQVDLGKQRTIRYIATQGRDRYFERVNKFKIGYSNDGTNFKYYGENGKDKEFIGNCDHFTPVVNQFHDEIHARYVRYYPTEWNYPCVRMEFYGC